MRKGVRLTSQISHSASPDLTTVHGDSELVFHGQGIIIILLPDLLSIVIAIIQHRMLFMHMMHLWIIINVQLFIPIAVSLLMF